MAELVDATDSKSVELRFMSVRVGLGVPLSEEFSNISVALVSLLFHTTSRIKKSLVKKIVFKEFPKFFCSRMYLAFSKR